LVKVSVNRLITVRKTNKKQHNAFKSENEFLFW